MKNFKLIVISLLIAFPGTFVVSFLMTPLLWRLEPVLGIELAGHSGPADWVFEVNLVVIAVLAFVLLKIASRILSSKENRSQLEP